MSLPPPEGEPVVLVDRGMIVSVLKEGLLGMHESGQIIATSHDLTPNGGLVREIPLFQGNPGW